MVSISTTLKSSDIQVVKVRCDPRNIEFVLDWYDEELKKSHRMCISLEYATEDHCEDNGDYRKFRTDAFRF
jgi:hypothetical protein